MTCAEIKDRLVDYLYGELPAGERTAFEAHLGGCDGCRAEVGALQGTLVTTRVAMKSLEEAPPARVRLAVLEAARAAIPVAVSAGASAPVGAAAAMPRRGPDKSGPREQRAPERGGLWEWLRRPWLVPAGLAFAAVAVLVIARETLTNPSVVDEASRPIPSVTQEAPAVRTDELELPAPAPRDQPTAAASEERELGRGELEKAKSVSRPRPAMRRPASPAVAPPAVAPPAERAAPGRGYAEPPPPRASRSKESLDDRLSGLLGGEEKSADKADGRREGAASGAGIGGLAGPARGGGEAKNEADRAAPAKPQRTVVTQGERAPEPKPASVSSRAAQAAPPRMAPPATPPAPPPPAPTPAPAPVASTPAPAQEPMANAAPAGDADSAFEEAERPRAAKKSGQKGRAPSPLEEAVTRADRLFAAGNWSEALRAYNELVRLNPQHRDVPVWKGRVRACTQALRDAPASKRQP